MSDPVLCNVCLKPISDPIEAAKKRIYVVKGTGRPLPIQRKHDVCDAAYADEKTGLQKVKS